MKHQKKIKTFVKKAGSLRECLMIHKSSPAGRRYNRKRQINLWGESSVLWHHDQEDPLHLISIVRDIQNKASEDKYTM